MYGWNRKMDNSQIWKHSSSINIRVNIHQFSSVQSLSHVWLFATPWTTVRQAALSITNSQSPPKPISIVLAMPSNYLILCHPLLLLPSIFPSIRVFQMSQLSTSCGQSIQVSASTSVPPMNTQDWPPLGWTDWIFLQPKGFKSLLQHHSSKASIFQCSALCLHRFCISTWINFVSLCFSRKLFLCCLQFSLIILCLSSRSLTISSLFFLVILVIRILSSLISFVKACQFY